MATEHQDAATGSIGRPPSVLRSEWALWVGITTTALFFMFGDRWLADLSSPLWFLLLLTWLFVVMLRLCFAVVHHAEVLAHKLGEPYGTLILTLSVIGIEVAMIAAIMLTGKNNPTLARDMMFSVLMIVLNGILGLALLMGGWHHREQAYNVKGTSAYLGVLIPLAGLGLILPRFTTSAPGGQLSRMMDIYLTVMSAVLYAVFLFVQTMRHRDYFMDSHALLEHQDTEHDPAHATRSVLFHAVFLALNILPIVLLSKKMAVLLDHGITTLSAPEALVGLLVAILVLSPEAVSAVSAGLANRLQRSVNLALGSGLSTIGMTIPAVLLISLLIDRPVELGLEATDIVLLSITLLVSVVNFGGEHTNILKGIVHLVLFLTYIMLIFD